MTADELVKEVRFQLVMDHRRGGPGVSIWEVQGPARHDYIATRSNIRAQERILINSHAFRQLASGYVRARVIDPVSEILFLKSWLAILKHVMNTEGGPQGFVQRVLEQEKRRDVILTTLRSAADALADDYATRLKSFADEIERNESAIRGHSFNKYIVSIENFGRRGAAAALQDGAWRGWLIRELRDRLPSLTHFKPNEYAMIAYLLTWAGINGVNSILVRSILERGRT